MTNSPRPVLHTDTPLRDPVVHALWRALSTEQRMHLLALRHGRIGDITLHDIATVRRNVIDAPSVVKGVR